MSARVCDKHGRWRSIDVSFRVSPEENEQINKFVALSGLTKRAYISKRLLHQDIIVVGNPRIYRALKQQMSLLYTEFRRLCDATQISPETMELLRFITTIYGEMKNEGDLPVNIEMK